MKRKKIIKSYAIVIATALCIGSSNVNASQLTTEQEVSNEIYEKISFELEKYISEYYEGIYSLSDFDIEYEEEADNVLDAIVTVNMTLVRKPADSPFVIGMESVIETMENEDEK